MARPSVRIKIPRKARVDESTRFTIDYTWWESEGRSLEAYLTSRLGQEISLGEQGRSMDIIDSETGEVRQLTGFEFAVQNLFSQSSTTTELMQRGSLVDAVFTVLMANGNRPMSSIEIGERIKRAPETIYKTIGGAKIYLGIRPVLS